MPAANSRRFLTLADVADILNISAAQTYALVRRGDLPAIKIGGRGQWRVESDQLEAYIKAAYVLTGEFIDEHPFEADDEKETHLEDEVVPD
ncbi:MAG: helix-turn-helix domain-containing protein [Nocardioidaceae bacterium]|nr:helix-turn-helix domain-containing protein [Nocardioidaceae bacterium]